MSLLSLLDQTCNISVAPVTIDAYGIPTDGSATLTASPCAIQVDGSQEGIEYQRSTGRVAYRIYFPSTVSMSTLTTKANIVATSGPYSGRTFESVSPPVDNAGRGGSGTYRKVLATEVV